MSVLANDQGNPAAAKNLRFQNTPDPPLGLTALFAYSSRPVHCWNASLALP